MRNFCPLLELAYYTKWDEKGINYLLKSKYEFKSLGKFEMIYFHTISKVPKDWMIKLKKKLKIIHDL